MALTGYRSCEKAFRLSSLLQQVRTVGHSVVCRGTALSVCLDLTTVSALQDRKKNLQTLCSSSVMVTRTNNKTSGVSDVKQVVKVI